MASAFDLHPGKAEAIDPLRVLHLVKPQQFLYRGPVPLGDLPEAVLRLHHIQDHIAARSPYQASAQSRTGNDLPAVFFQYCHIQHQTSPASHLPGRQHLERDPVQGPL